jgi:hypothetical protein
MVAPPSFMRPVGTWWGSLEWALAGRIEGVYLNNLWPTYFDLQYLVRSRNP